MWTLGVWIDGVVEDIEVFESLAAVVRYMQRVHGQVAAEQLMKHGEATVGDWGLTLERAADC